MTKKTKTQKPSARRWSIGLFVSVSNGEPIVAYCRKDGTIAPYLAKTVKNKKAALHAIYTGMTYAQARAKLLKEAKVSGAPKGAKKVLAKASAKTPAVAKEELQRKAA